MITLYCSGHSYIRFCLDMIIALDLFVRYVVFEAGSEYAKIITSFNFIICLFPVAE